MVMAFYSLLRSHPEGLDEEQIKENLVSERIMLYIGSMLTLTTVLRMGTIADALATDPYSVFYYYIMPY